MSASERLRELDGVATNGPWKITTFDFAPGRFWLEGPPAEGYEGEIPEPDAKLITTLRNALPLIADVVEAAETMHEWLYNERESHEPPRALLDKGFVSMIDSPTYERDEEMDDKLAAALTALRDALEQK